MANPARVLLREDFVVQKGEGCGLREAAEAGLNPKVFRSAMGADVGRAGRVNLNGRIYPVEEAIREHERVCREETFNPAHLTHPETAENFDICAGLVGGETVIEADGSVLMRAEFGLLDSYLGKHIEVLYEAGLPIGFSSRGWGIPEAHKLDEASPYLGMNPGAKGQTVQLIREFMLEGYDAVRVPSAEVYADAPKNVRESLHAVREHLQSQATAEDQIPLEENDVPTSVGGGSKMLLKDIKTLAELQEHAPDVAALLLAKADEATEAEAQAKTALDEANAKIAELTEKAEAAELAEAGKEDALKALTEQVAEMKREMEAKEAEAQAAIARAALRVEVVAHLDEALRGVTAQGVIRKQVLEGFDGGRVTDLDSAKALVEEKLEIVSASSLPPKLGLIVPQRQTEDAERAPATTTSPAPRARLYQ